MLGIVLLTADPARDRILRSGCLDANDVAALACVNRNCRAAVAKDVRPTRIVPLPKGAVIAAVPVSLRQQSLRQQSLRQQSFGTTGAFAGGWDFDVGARVLAVVRGNNVDTWCGDQATGRVVCPGSTTPPAIALHADGRLLSVASGVSSDFMQFLLQSSAQALDYHSTATGKLLFHTFGARVRSNVTAFVGADPSRMFGHACFALAYDERRDDLAAPVAVANLPADTAYRVNTHAFASDDGRSWITLEPDASTLSMRLFGDIAARAGMARWNPSHSPWSLPSSCVAAFVEGDTVHVFLTYNILLTVTFCGDGNVRTTERFLGDGSLSDVAVFGNLVSFVVDGEALVVRRLNAMDAPPLVYRMVSYVTMRADLARRVVVAADPMARTLSIIDIP